MVCSVWDYIELLWPYALAFGHKTWCLCGGLILYLFVVQALCPAYQVRRRPLILLLMKFAAHLRVSELVASGAVVLLDRIFSTGVQINSRFEGLLLCGCLYVAAQLLGVPAPPVPAMLQLADR